MEEKKGSVYIRFMYSGALGLTFNCFCKIFLEVESMNTGTLIL